MKILHLIVDHQVIERTLDIYESVFPGKNSVIIFGPTNEYKRLKKYSDRKFIKTGNGRKEAKLFEFSSFTHIIAHYMTMDMIDFIKSASCNIKVIWEIYGADLYNQFLCPLGYELFYTDPVDYHKYGLYIKHFPFLFNVALELKGYKYSLPFRKHTQFKYISNRINAIQYCCYYDAKYVESFAKKAIHSYEIFNYSLNEVLGNLKDTPFYNGRDVLIGNSASFSNNHLYILTCLKKMSLTDDVHMILPMSYGGVEAYIEDVEKAYKTSLNCQIEVIRDYRPLHVYNQLFLRLNSIVLSAWRQESQGTAIMGLYLGLKVFMSEKSPLYKWFVDCGFTVFTIESASKEDLITPLSIDIKIANRDIVLRRYDNRVFVETLKTNFSDNG